MVAPDEAAARPPTPSTGANAVRCWSCGSAIGSAWPCPRCGQGGAPPATLTGPAGFLARLGKGAFAPFRGLSFLGAHAGLWTWIVVPLVVNALLCALSAWFLASNLEGWLPDLAEPWPAWIDWARTSLGWLLTALAWAASLLVAAIATVVLSGVVNSPFFDLLSEKVEAAHFGLKDPGRPLGALIGDIVRSLGASLWLLSRWLLVMVVLLMLSFTVVGAPLMVLAGLYYGGLTQVDLVMARKLYPGRQRTAWARAHFPLLVGLGIPISLLPLLLPFGIVGATLAWLEEPDKG